MKNYHKARYSLLYCETVEDERFIRHHRSLIEEDVTFFKWDIAEGFKVFAHPGDNDKAWVWDTVAMREDGEDDVKVMIPATSDDEPVLDPKTAMKFCKHLPGNSIIFVYDMHKFFPDEMAGIEVIRQILNEVPVLVGNSQMIVFLSAVKYIPAELRKDVTVIDFALPNEKDLDGILRKTCEDNAENGIIYPENAQTVVDSIRGMSQKAAENALALSLVQHGKFDTNCLLDEKAATIKATNYLTYVRYTESFDGLFGLEKVKKYILDAVNGRMLNGILLDGIPGGGKSHLAKAVANATKRPCLIADFSSLRTKYQGEAESNINDLLNTIEAFGRPIVFVDEFDKSLAGLNGANTDGGVGSRIMQAWLRYMQDKEPGGSYWVCTSNSLDTICNWSGGAILRRLEGKYFIDMPTKDDCRGIAKIWSKKWGTKNRICLSLWMMRRKRKKKKF